MSVFSTRPNSAGLTNHRFFPFVFGGVGFSLIIGLILWFGMPATPEPSRTLPPDPFQDPAAGAAHIRELAQRYGSDFDRLSADDRLFLNSIARGHGRELLTKTVKEIKLSPVSKSASPAP